MNRSALKVFVAGAFLWIASAFPVLAQTSPSWTYGYVPTLAQWNAQWASKQDYLGAPPLLTTGGTMTGRLTTKASTTSIAGFNLPAGVDPTSPTEGDLWITTSGFFARVNGVTIGPIGGATSSSFAASSPLSVSFPAGVVTYACATCAVTTNPLSQFAATTSAQLLGVLSDETGSGLAVFNNSPTLITPTLGVATATSINKVTITTPATSAILTIANGKTLTASNTLTFTGTDGTSFAFPGSSDTVVTLGAAQTLTGKTLTATSNVLGGVTMTLGSDATGDIYYRNSSGFLTRLGVGANTNVLTLSGGLPSWQAGSSAASITIGTTTVNTGTTLNFLYNNAGVLANTPLVAGNGITLSGTANATITNSGVVKVQPAQKLTGSGTYTPTTGMIYVQVECVGAGGGGGGTADNSVIGAGAGGGSGAYSRVILTAAQIGASKTYAAGTAGAAGAAGFAAGGTGGDTTFGTTLCVAKGGIGGGGTSAPGTVGAGGAGGLASGGTGDVKITGNAGQPGMGANFVTANFAGGNGAGSFFGGGGAGAIGTGGAATDCGGGGGAGGGNNTGNQPGGAGGGGCIVLTEFTSQ